MSRVAFPAVVGVRHESSTLAPIDAELRGRCAPRRADSSWRGPAGRRGNEVRCDRSGGSASRCSDGHSRRSRCNVGRRAPRASVARQPRCSAVRAALRRCHRPASPSGAAPRRCRPRALPARAAPRRCRQRALPARAAALLSVSGDGLSARRVCVLRWPNGTPSRRGASGSLGPRRCRTANRLARSRSNSTSRARSTISARFALGREWLTRARAAPSFSFREATSRPGEDGAVAHRPRPGERRARPSAACRIARAPARERPTPCPRARAALDRGAIPRRAKSASTSIHYCAPVRGIGRPLCARGSAVRAARTRHPRGGSAPLAGPERSE